MLDLKLMTLIDKVLTSYAYAVFFGFVKHGKFGNDKFITVNNAGIKGEGLYTTKKRKCGEVVFIATGPSVYAHFEGDDVYKYPDWYSVEKDIWIDIKYPYVKINHSCDPNTGISGSRCFIALRDIKDGEELTFDYSITDDEPDWKMCEQCACGSVGCAQHIGPVWTMSSERYNRSYPFIPKYFQKLYKEKHLS